MQLGRFHKATGLLISRTAFTGSRKLSTNIDEFDELQLKYLEGDDKGITIAGTC